MQVLTLEQVEQPEGQPRQTPLTLNVLVWQVRQVSEESQSMQLEGHSMHCDVEEMRAYP